MINFLKKHLPPRVKQIIKKLIKKQLGSKPVVEQVVSPAPTLSVTSEPEITNNSELNETITAAPELAQNAKFINSHEGEECFVLGNGPSLKRVNLDKLKDKFVITVNRFTKVTGYEKVHSNIHILVDVAYFDSNNLLGEEELNKIWEDIEKMKIPVFVPLVAKNYINNKELEKKIDIHYLDILVNEIPDRFGTPLKIDILKPINSYTNVIQFAIVLAINMGFKKINLIGCDATSIYAILNAAEENKDIEIHGYENDNAKDIYKKLMNKMKLAESLFWESFNFLGYERLSELCVQKGIKLINLTDKSLIDSVPKEYCEDLYK